MKLTLLFKKHAFFSFIFLCFLLLNATDTQAAIWYSNNTTANTNANLNTNWSGDRFGGTGNPVAALNTADTFVIQPGHQYKLTATWTGNAGGIIQIESGGALDLNAQTITNLLRFDIAGTGVSSSGALFTSSGTYTINKAITLTAAATIRSSGSGTLTLSGTLTNGGNTLTIDGAQATTMTGNNTGAGGLTKNGAGTLTLNTGTITYSGTTTVNAGILAPGAANKLSPNSALVVVSGGTVNIATFAQTVLSISDGGGAGGIITGTSGNLTFGDATNTTYSGTITTTTGGITKNGTGITTLSGTNTFTGTTTINAGTIKYGANNVLSTGAVTVSGGTLDLATFTDSVGTVQLTSGSINSTTGVLTSTATYDMQNGTVSAILAGGVGLTKTTAGTVTLSGTNTFTGVTTISAGILSVATIGNGGVAGNLGAATNAAANLFLNGGTLQYTGANASTDRNYTLNAGSTSTIDVTTNTLTISGASTVTTGALTKTGAGTLTLSGANGYTGLTTVSAGTLPYGANNTLSSGAVTVNGGTLAMLTFTDTVGAVTLSGGGLISGTTGILTGTSYAMQDGTVSAILAGAVALTKTTVGTVTLSGVNTYTGITTISAGTLSVGIIGNGGTAGNLGQATNTAANLVLDGGTLQYTGATASTDRNFTLIAAKTSTLDVTTNNLTISGASTATTGALTKTGAGFLVLSGTNVYTGATTISAGTLQLSGASGTVISDSSALVVNATLDMNGKSEAFASISGSGLITSTSAGTCTITHTGGASTYSGVIQNGSGTLAVTKSGAGILLLSGSNTYTGATIINNGGTLQAGSTTAFGNCSPVNLTATGKLDLNGNSLSVGSLQSATASFVDNTAAGTATLTICDGNGQSFSGAIIDTGGTLSLVKDGAGTQTLSGANTYAGSTTISLGTLKLGAAGVIPDTSAVTITGTLDMGGLSETVGSIAGSGGIMSSATGVITLTSGGNNSDTVYSGVCSNGSATSIGLTKSGTGELTLTNTNTYTGITTITGGKIAVSSNANLGANASISLNGGTLHITATMTLSKAISITTNHGTLEVDSSYTLTSSGVISNSTTTANLTKTGAGSLIASGTNTYTGTTTISAGTFELGNNNVLAVNATPTNSLITLNGAILSTGSNTGKTDSIGPLDLSGGTESSITLGTGSHTLTFTNSSGQTWDGTLAITGWTGTLGASGTSGKVYFGAALTSVQLDLITINGNKVTQLGGPNFEVVPIGLCTQPTAQPTGLMFSSVTKTSITLNFTAASPTVSKYLILRSTESNIPTPENETTYVADNTIYTGMVMQSSSSTTFTDIGLCGGTTYYYFIYAYNDGCSGVSPYYLVSNPLKGSVTTSAPNVYYVNDSTFNSQDIYTTAAGNAANSGSTPGSPKASLTAALALAGGGDWIYVDSGTYSDNYINFNTAGIKIIGAGPSQTIYKGAGTSGIYFGNVTADNLIFKGLMITNYYRNSTGFALDITNAQGIVMDNNSVYGNIGAGGDAAIKMSSNSNMILKNVIHPCNRIGASNYGGALWVSDSDVVILNSSYSDNIKSSDAAGGGAITIDGASNVYIEDSTFTNNIADHGGAISVNGTANLYINGCIFTSNEANEILGTNKGGGAIYIGTGSTNTVSIANSSFTGNFASPIAEGNSEDGGAITAASGKVVIDTCNFTQNSTGDKGEDIYIDGATMYIKNSDFKTVCSSGSPYPYYTPGVAHTTASALTGTYSSNDYNIWVATGTLYMYNSGSPSVEGSGVATTNPEISGTTNTNYLIGETTRTGTTDENWTDNGVGGTTDVQLLNNTSYTISPDYTVGETSVVVRFDAMRGGASAGTKNQVKVEYSVNGGAYSQVTGSPFQENGLVLVSKTATITGLTAGNVINIKYSSPNADGTNGIILDNLKLTQTNITQKDSDAVITATDKYTGDCALPTTPGFISGFKCDSANTWDLSSTSTSTAKSGILLTSLATSKTITAGVYSSGNIVFTCASHGYAIGDWVQIAGTSNHTWNRAFKITATTSNTFTVSASNLIEEAYTQINGTDVSFQKTPTSGTTITGTVAKTTATTNNLYGWSNEKRPSSDDYVLLNQDYNTSIYGNIDACRLKVAAGKTLTIDNDDPYSAGTDTRGSYVYVVNSIYNTNDNLEIGSTGTTNPNKGYVVVKANGNLVQVNHPLDYKNDAVITPKITFYKTTATKNKYAYTYWCLPFETSAGSFNQLMSTTVSSSTFFSRPYYWDSSKCGTTIDRSYLGWQTVTTQPAVGVGFITMHNTAGDASIAVTGITTNGNYSVPTLQYDGNYNAFRNFNLTGNPYPGAIDFFDFYEQNKTTIYGTVYIWASPREWARNIGGDPTQPGLMEYYDEDYIALNLSGCIDCEQGSKTGLNYQGSDLGYNKQNKTFIDGVIPSGQAFMIRPKNNNGVTFNNTNRSKKIPNNAYFFRLKEKDRYWINITQADLRNKEQLVAYLDGSTIDFDDAYDAPLNTISKLKFYSYLNNEKYSIQSRGEFKDTDVVNIGFEKTNALAGEKLIISISKKEGLFEDRQPIYLYDKELERYTDLNKRAYEFILTANTENRFEIVYKLPDTEQINADNNNTVVASINDNILNINADADIDTVILYDLTGKLIFEKTMDRKSNIVNTPLYISTGVYIARVTLSNTKTHTLKLIKE